MNSRRKTIKRKCYWVYDFSKQYELSVRTDISVLQILAPSKLKVKWDNSFKEILVYYYSIYPLRFLANTVKAELFVIRLPEHTAHEKGNKTIWVRVVGLSLIRFTLCLPEAMVELNRLYSLYAKVR